VGGGDFTAVSLKFEDLKQHNVFIFKDKAVQETDRLILKMKTLHTFSMTQQYIPEDLNPQQNHCGNLNPPQYNNDQFIASAILRHKVFGTYVKRIKFCPGTPRLVITVSTYSVKGRW
jgi:hypothetical protein